MSNVLGSLALVSSQADEHDVSLSNVNLNKACDAGSGAEFNADVFKPEASKNFKAAAAEHGSKFNSNEANSDKSQKTPNNEISFGGEKFRLKRYCGQRVYHIIFPRGYFGAPYVPHLAKRHPIWRFEGGRGRL